MSREMHSVYQFPPDGGIAVVTVDGESVSNVQVYKNLQEANKETGLELNRRKNLILLSAAMSGFSLVIGNSLVNQGEALGDQNMISLGICLVAVSIAGVKLGVADKLKAVRFTSTQKLEIYKMFVHDRIQRLESGENNLPDY